MRCQSPTELFLIVFSAYGEIWDDAAWVKWEEEQEKLAKEFGDPDIPRRSRWWEENMWSALVRCVAARLARGSPSYSLFAQSKHTEGKHGSVYYIGGLATDKSVRNRGVAATLIKYVIDQANNEQREVRCPCAPSSSPI